MMDLSIVVLPGDGIGPEVIDQALLVLSAVCGRAGHRLETKSYPFGSAGMDAAGTGFPDETRKACQDTRAILFGAVGDPKYDHLPPSERPEVALLHLRRMLGSFANLRPVAARQNHPRSPFRDEAIEGTDLLIVRELTGGLYFGEPRGIEGVGADRRGYNTLVYTVAEIERIARVAFESAMKRRRRLISVDKANVLESSKLWREVVNDMAKEYPEVELENMYVDRAAMEVVTHPKQIDVMVTGNLFGDILSDEASVLAGSLGMLPSASIGGDTGLFEPVHGSAPDIVGKGLANPLGAIASVAMMLRHAFDLEHEATWIDYALDRAFATGTLTADLKDDAPTSTSGVGEFVASTIDEAP